MEEVLRGNLERLRCRDPGLAEAVENADPACVERCAARSGATTLRAEGVLLGSAWDPAEEAEALAAEMARTPDDVLMAIGIGLGRHLDAYRRRRGCPLLLLEPSAARLRAALSLAPLPWLADPDVEVVLEADALGHRLGRRYLPGLRMRVFVHPSAWRLAPEQVRAAVGRIARVKDAADVIAATRVSRLADWTRLTVENTPHLLRTPGLSRLRGAFQGVPAVIAAAGPSLERQLPLLAREAERLLVVGIGPSLGSLRLHGIRPDLVHVLESADVAHQLTRAGPTEDLNLVLTPKTHPRLFELPVRTRFVAYTAAERFASWMARELGESLVLQGAGSVALSAVYLAASLGANPILLIGQDLAFTGGQVYAKGSCYEAIGIQPTGPDGFAYTRMEDRSEAYEGDPRRMEQASRQRLVWVEGWNGDPVPTSVSYASFIEQYKEIGASLARSGITLLNCTEGGARLPGVPQVEFAEALGRCRGPRPEATLGIQRAFDGATPWDAGQLVRPLARARRELAGLTRETRRGIRALERGVARLGRCGREQEKLGPLLRARGVERAMRRRLARTPWIEGVVQAELHQALPLLHRASRAEPSPEQALEECLLLLRATAQGIERAARLFDRFEELALPGGAGRSGGAAHPGRLPARAVAEG